MLNSITFNVSTLNKVVCIIIALDFNWLQFNEYLKLSKVLNLLILFPSPLIYKITNSKNVLKYEKPPV